jgi:hypothetical protein
VDDGPSSDIQLDIHHWDARTGWRRVLNWRPGQRTAIKRRSHQRDRRAERRRLRQPASS